MSLTLTKKLTLALSGFFCLLSSQTGFAVSVIPGAGSLLSGTTSAANPDLGGVVIRDQLIPFQINDNLGNTLITGNVQDRVVRSSNTGQLIFAPRLRDLNNPSGVAWIEGFSMLGFNGFTTDIDYRTDGLGNVGPNSVNRSASGDLLDYRYSPSLIVPPDEGYFLSVLTDTNNFDLSGAFIITAGNDFGSSAFSTRLLDVSAPSAIPLPAAVWLFGSGLLGLLGISRRKFKTINN